MDDTRMFNEQKILEQTGHYLQMISVDVCHGYVWKRLEYGRKYDIIVWCILELYYA